MAGVHLEVEAKYDVDEGFALPDLVDVFRAGREPGADDAAPWAEGAAAEHDLAATYYDTADLRLAAARLTLRRRTGGEDAGWHLKVPRADGARSEVRVDLAPGEDAGTDGPVPEQLVAMTWAVTLGHPLVPVARLRTHRAVRRLVDVTGRVLVEVADDHVTARRVHPSDAPGDVVGAEQAWREVEVEVVDGPPDLLATAEPRLVELGLRPSASASKLARTLGTEGAAPDEVGPALTAASPAGDVVLARLRAQVEQIRAQDLPVRLDTPGAVHAMRVATRRLRSALTTFERLLHRSATRPVRRELRWLARELGAVRDAEVMRDRLAGAMADAVPDAPAAVAREVSASLDGAYATARERLLGALDGDRYRALLRALDALLTETPWRGRAARPASDVLPRLVRAADDDVRAAVRAARREEDPAARETARHEARKAAKRARYAGEAVAVVLGDDAAAYAEAMEAVQEALGEHLDARHAGVLLERLAHDDASAATAFAYGRLHAHEERRAAHAEAAVDAAWDAASGKDLRRWMR
ncbi:CYTH and CHAD domain-containing protein [Actinotalea solisilvae]|uniref:CYTH and CHAD domain-containing protein n=1 Tax=Actinotalea solisilvae TaxID=2072922 RepID=UPI0018F166BA|nr:CYTH and CHAD domain-containing protein [Actinotalea solisilvae]